MLNIAMKVKPFDALNAQANAKTALIAYLNYKQNQNLLSAGNVTKATFLAALNLCVYHSLNSPAQSIQLFKKYHKIILLHCFSAEFVINLV